MMVNVSGWGIASSALWIQVFWSILWQMTIWTRMSGDWESKEQKA